MIVLDASALLVFLQGEDGADAVEAELGPTCRVSAANWSEAAQKVRAGGGSWALARGILQSYGVAVEPVLAEDAENAALLWERGGSLSLADRLCLATAERLDAGVLTADRDWGSGERVRQVR